VVQSQTADAYKITVLAPNKEWTVQDINASCVDRMRSIAIEGSVAKKGDDLFQYQTRRRTAIFSEPSRHALVGTVPMGSLVRGSAPSPTGWIALSDADDETLFTLDDGSLALVGRPAPSRARPFAKRVSLPADAMTHRATSEQRGDGFIVVIPRSRPAAPPPRQVPVNVKRPAPSQRAERPAKSSPADRPSPMDAKRAFAGRKEERREEHRNPTSQRRAMHHALHSLLGDEEAGPVLIECDAMSTNVQSPSEDVEEWVANKDGGFRRASEMEATEAEAAKVDSLSTTEEDNEQDSWVDCSDETAMDDDLSYWGF